MHIVTLQHVKTFQYVTNSTSDVLTFKCTYSQQFSYVSLHEIQFYLAVNSFKFQENTLHIWTACTVYKTVVGIIAYSQPL